MAAIPPDDDRPRDEMTMDELRANALKHGFVLDDWSVNPSPFQQNELDPEFP
jgi:hypothetical protein